MPFDGVDAARVRIPRDPHRVEQRQRRAALKLQPGYPGKKLIRLRRQAGKSVLILDAMMALFGNGESWVKQYYDDGQGGYCLMGALHLLRKTYGNGDRAGVYIQQAIRELSWVGHERVTRFNDDWFTTFAKVKAVMVLARAMAFSDAEPLHAG